MAQLCDSAPNEEGPSLFSRRVVGWSIHLLMFPLI